MIAVFNFLGKTFDLSKKILLVFFTLLIVFTLFTVFMNQDKPVNSVDPIKQNRIEIYKVLNDKKLNSNKQSRVSLAFFRVILCGMMGEACTNNPNDADTIYYKRSLLGSMSKLLMIPFANPPASGIYWAYSGLQNAGFIPKTYAAEGLGFAALRPLINIWKIFRDVAFALLVLVLIIAGFMIMFRMKMNPQTVISIESALPRLVITLLLITFSFAIAGFLIDMMYVVIALSINILSGRGNYYNATEFQNRYINAGFFEIWNGMFPSSTKIPFLSGFGSIFTLSTAIMNMLPDFINQLLRMVLGIAGVYSSTFLLLGPANEIIKTVGKLGGSIPVGETISAGLALILQLATFVIFGMIGFGLGYTALPIVIMLFVGVTILFLLFRIFFMLFTTYIKIIIMIVFSPIFLLFEAIPGKSAFSYWIKNLTGELLTFPVVVVIFLVGYDIVYSTANTGTMWRPPFLTDVNPNALSVLLGMGFIFMIPEFVKMVKELLGVKGLPMNFGIGTFFSGAGAAFGGGMAGLNMASSLTQVPVIGPAILGYAQKNQWLGKMLPQTIGQQVVDALKPKGPGASSV